MPQQSPEEIIGVTEPPTALSDYDHEAASILDKMHAAGVFGKKQDPPTPIEPGDPAKAMGKNDRAKALAKTLREMGALPNGDPKRTELRAQYRKLAQEEE